MSANISSLQAERKQLRRLFTLTAKLVESALTAQPVDLEKVNVEFAKLADKAERLFAVDREVKEIFFADEKLYSNDEDVEKEYQGVEGYRETWITITSKREALLEKMRQPPRPDPSVESTSSEKLRFKIPKIELRKFDVQPRTWIAFWAAFKKFDERDDLDDDYKFQVLLQMTKEGTTARKLLDKFPPSSENYQKALGRLKQRFGRTELLIEVYVRDLLGLVIGQAKGSEGSSDIHELVENLESKLMGLESLGITTERFSCLLLPLVESTLPEPVIREWERTKSPKNTEVDSSLIDDATLLMNQLREFLKKVVVSDERVSMVRTSFLAPKLSTEKEKVGAKKPPQSQKVASATGLVSLEEAGETKQKCVFCTLAHPSEYCFKAREMEHERKIQLLKENKICFRCLKRFHGMRRCKGTVRCLVCSKGHCTSMCQEKEKKEDPPAKPGSAAPEVEKNLSNTNCVPVLMQTLQVRVNSAVGPTTARVLIDTGSQRSYITRELAAKMDYEPVREEKVVHALFGGTTTDVVTHKCYKVRLQRLSGTYSCNFDVLDSEKICNTIPALPKGPWMNELREKKIPVSDTEEGPIDVLVGSDIAGKLFTGRKKILSCGLVAMETCLGWTVMGRIRNEESNFMLNVATLCTVDLSPSELWELDAIGIKDPADIATQEEARTAAREHFMNTVKTLEDGRYEVCLPWLAGHPPLPRGFQQAACRLESTVRKLRSDGLFEAYEGVFKEWLAEGIIEEVPFENWDNGHYLPHRAVLKEGSTTRIRPVFDASAHEKGKPNLNQCLEKGDNLIEKIPSVLMRFRLKEIGLIADIRKAFLMISVNESDRDFLRFLWTDGEGNMKIFRHKRVVFGVTSSPYLLGAVIEHHLDRCAEKAAACDKSYALDMINQLRKSLYVDNCVTSVSTEEEKELFVEKAKSIFLEACFDLRGWEWSDSSLPCSTITPVLGVMWDRKSDVLKVNPPNLENFEGEVTRRSVLSASQKLFDPLGTCSPTSLIPRLIIQESWANGGTWDTPLSENGKKAFLKWSSEISALNKIEIPRWVKASVNPSDVTLHVFCDASQHAYATVCYLRVETAGEVFVTLVAAKARVAPLKKVTIPRLELLAATIGSRLASNVLKELGNVKCYFWSDSTTTLSWIRREEPWGVFVFNRVKEIRNLTRAEDWHHVPGTMNPADLASRGCSPQTLLESRWWEGPQWLHGPTSEWPSTEIDPDEKEVLEERRKTPIVTTLVQSVTFSTACFNKFSKYSRILRVGAWMYRYLFNKYSKRSKTEGELTVPEIERAEKLLLKMVQEESFEGIKDKILKKLKPRVDSDGLIRLRTKIWARKDSEDFRSPIILPGGHGIVKKLVMETHKRNGHVVGTNLLNLLRERFWIIHGRRAIKKILAECSICQRHRAKSFEVESPPLPESRVRDANVFEICGVDLAGPLYLADGSKVWIVLFTCAIYRAVHLEIVTSQSTESFMMAFRRFVALRGRPSIIYSDNGLNFRGTHNALEGLDWNQIAVQGTIDRIEWRFNPPRAAWWGGFWERLVGSVKVILRKILGRASLTHEELATIIYECATYINQRPLTYLSEDPADPVPITPQMFLSEIPSNEVPDLDAVDAKSLKRKLQRRVLLKEELRRRFRIEYLGQLNFAPGGFKDKRCPRVGELVLVGSDLEKRIDWPLAVVEELTIGKDGKCRAVKMRTAQGHLTRAIQHVFPLEIDSIAPEPPVTTSKPSSDVIEPEQDVESSVPEDVVPQDHPVEDAVADPELVMPLAGPEPEPPKMSKDVGKKKEAKREEKCVVKKCETRCGRKVKLPIKYND